MADVIDFGDEKRRRIADEAAKILGEATSKTPRRRTAKPAPLVAGATMYINNSGEISGQIAGGDIHNHTHTKPQRAPKVVVQPSDDVISEAQKVALVKLRDEWIALHNAIKVSKLTYGGAQKAINSWVQVTSYHLIPSAKYNGVVARIKREMGRLRNMASAPAKDPKWRSSKITAIKLRCRNQLGDPEAYKKYILKNFHASSLTDLSTSELQRTYTYIMAKKPPI